MGKRKKDELKRQLSEAVDPRFSHLFKSGNAENYIEPTNQVLTSTHSRDDGFQKFVSNKLTEFLDKSIKEVDLPIVKSNIFSNRIEGIRLFSDSEIITDIDHEEKTPIKTQKKQHKRKKIFSEESIKEVAVTSDWLKKQAQILNS